MTDLYLECLAYPDELICGKTYNAGYENRTVLELAQAVREVVGPEVEIVIQPSDDLRSYHISSEKIKRELGFAPRRGVRDAVKGLVAALRSGRVPEPMTDKVYYNIRTMQAARLA